MNNPTQRIENGETLGIHFSEWHGWRRTHVAYISKSGEDFICQQASLDNATRETTIHKSLEDILSSNPIKSHLMNKKVSYSWEVS